MSGVLKFIGIFFLQNENLLGLLMLPSLLRPQIDLLFNNTSCHHSSHLLLLIERKRLLLLKPKAETINSSVILSCSSLFFGCFFNWGPNLKLCLALSSHIIIWLLASLLQIVFLHAVVVVSLLLVVLVL